MNPSNFPYDLSLKMDSNPSLPGLDSFLRSLEHMFFGEVKAQLLALRTGERNLVLNLKCNLHLHEVLHHHGQGTWGPASQAGGKNKANAGLNSLLKRFQQVNPNAVDIEELNLELNDILLVIRRIGPNSILNELQKLLGELRAHYEHITCGFRSTPYEIYIPVSEAGIAGMGSGEALNAEYYRYWAVYFEADVDARIYSLQGQKFLEETLFYGNPS